MKYNVFTEDDFNSNDGMLTYIWGPTLWHTLHTISFNYPVNPTKEQKKHYYKFFKNLENILPCKYCRDNYKNNLKVLPITSTVLKNRHNFSKWVYDLHELINTNLNKISGLTFEDVRNRYENFRSRCINDLKNSKEKGCTQSLYGLKPKCVLNIVPKDKKINTINIDKKCILQKKN
jgi:hypothetical protein